MCVHSTQLVAQPCVAFDGRGTCGDETVCLPEAQLPNDDPNPPRRLRVQFPPDSRVFVGNLAADKTSVAELEGLFRKYGRLGEPPILRRSFGFVQFEEPRCAQVTPSPFLSSLRRIPGLGHHAHICRSPALLS